MHALKGNAALLALGVLLVLGEVAAQEATSQKEPSNDPQYTGSCLRIWEIHALESTRDQLMGAVRHPTQFMNGSFSVGTSRYDTRAIALKATGDGMEIVGALLGGATPNSVYSFEGKTTLRYTPLQTTFVFEGDVADPITFVYTDQGLIYLQGKGRVVWEDGKSVDLPCPKKRATPAKAPAASASQPSRRQNSAPK